jgi:GNAT superfamily N-acetyltransferase
LSGLITKMAADKSPVEIVSGYRTGLIARITHMHMDYYSKAHGFGQTFESVVAGGLASFCDRLSRPVNEVWTAIRDGEILGSVAIDGEDLGDGIAHLRWFIVDEALRGTGAGNKLLNSALNFVEAKGFLETHLWTFAGLHAARHLYEARGFQLMKESSGSQWGTEVTEQLFVRRA